MKKVLVVLMAVVMVIAMVPQDVKAQRVMVEDDVYFTTAVKRFTSGTGSTISSVVYRPSDSTDNLPVSHSFDVGGQTQTLMPDSIQWVWWAKGYTAADSVWIYLEVVPITKGGTRANRYKVDSIQNHQNDYKTLASAWYQGADKLTFFATTVPYTGSGVTTSNQYKTNGGSYLFVRQRRFFTIK